MEYISPFLQTISKILFSLSILTGGSYTQPVTIVQPIEKVVETHTETRVETPPQMFAAISAAADFRSSLANGISSAATTMTLVSTSTAGGENLVPGKIYGFKLGGREYVLGTLSSGRQITGMTRGISLITGTSTGGVSAADWGRSTAVEITDAPVLLDIVNKANGIGNYEQPLRYDSSVATTTIDDDDRNLVNYEMLTYTAFNGAGVVNASASQKGVVEMATQLETASSTAAGSTGALLSIPASNATSTYNSATAPLRVIVTQNNGTIDPNFIPATTTKAFEFATTTYIGDFQAWQIGLQKQIITTLGTSTFSRPDGINKIFVEVIGPGGGGGSCAAGAGNLSGGGGGAAGGYANEIVDISASSTIQVFIGSGGAAQTTGGRTTFGTIGFEYLSATGGSGSVEGAGGSGGGIATGGDLNVTGMAGSPGGRDGASASDGVKMGGNGGSSRYGSGGLGSNGGGGGIATEYGSGGGGAACDNDSQTGGAGTQGLIIIRW